VFGESESLSLRHPKILVNTGYYQRDSRDGAVKRLRGILGTCPESVPPLNSSTPPGIATEPNYCAASHPTRFRKKRPICVALRQTVAWAGSTAV